MVGWGASGVSGVRGVVVEDGGTVVEGVSWGGSAALTRARLNSCALAAKVRAASAISATALAQGNCSAAALVLATVAANESDSASEHLSIFDFSPECWALLQVIYSMMR